jgi:hypothetical protein
MAGTRERVEQAHRLIASVRSFGGELANCPIWVFEARPSEAPCTPLQGEGVRILPLAVPETVTHYWFAGKVFACAQAEALAGPEVQSLVWISPDCLIVQSPTLFDLGTSFDAAARPVHIRNVGLPPSEPLNAFWRGVYQAVGIEEVEVTVESFVDGQDLRAYFNSHALAVRPAAGIFQRWFERFEALVCDEAYQSTAIEHELHRIFLHQAVLSALLVTHLEPEHIRLLPTSYIYPYNLHNDVPTSRRAEALNDLVCIAYEDRSLDPGAMDDILVHEPLRSWLADH